MVRNRDMRREHPVDLTAGGDCGILDGTLSPDLVAEILEWAPAACLVCDFDGGILQANRAAEVLTGLARDRLSTLALTDLISGGIPDDDPAARSPAAPNPRAKLKIRGDDRQVWVELEWHDLPGGRRALFLQDRTDERNTEIALFNSRRKYRELFEKTGDAILIIENGQFRDCNEATVRMLRYDSKEELLDTHPSELSPPEQPDGRPSFEKAEEMMRIAMEHGSHRFEWDHKRADGEVFPVEVLLTAVSVEEGRQILHTVWRDITDRRQAEEQLLQAQKLDSIGLLAGGVAHDFNNMLGGIMGHTSLLLDSEDEPDRRESLTEIMCAARRSAELTGKLLAFARKGKHLVAAVDLNGIVDEVLELLRHSFDKKIAFEVRHDSRLPSVDADPGQMHQVALNLCVNGCQALPRGGVLTVTTATCEIPAAGDPAWPELAAGPYVRLSVADDGLGMTDEVRQRAFEPFFSTREYGDVKGTGLGLSTVYGIVHNHGGAVHIESETGRGTTVTVLLPHGSRREEARQAGRRSVRRGGDCILVVDDEEIVRHMAERMLKKIGHTVLTAEDGREAVEIYRERHGEIDGVLLDLKMPHMDGMETLEKLQEIDPGVRIILSTGYGLNEESQQVLDAGARELVAKPYRLEELAEAVGRILG